MKPFSSQNNRSKFELHHCKGFLPKAEETGLSGLSVWGKIFLYLSDTEWNDAALSTYARCSGGRYIDREGSWTGVTLMPGTWIGLAPTTQEENEFS